MTTRKSTRSTPTRRTTTTKRTTTKRATAAKRTTRRRTTRRTTSVASTIGAGLGTLVVTALLNASWGVRIGLLAVVIVGGLVWIVWTKRAELAAMAHEEPDPAADEPQDAPSSGPQDSTPPAAGSAT